MKYAAIKSCDIANGPGVRVSLFVSGCRHHCKDCFNPETWDFAYGQPFDEAVMEHILALMAPDYIRGITYLGGEPFEPETSRGCSRCRGRSGRRTPKIHLVVLRLSLRPRYSGQKARPVGDDARAAVISRRAGRRAVRRVAQNLNLRFRGSSNQRLIDVPASLKTGAVVLWDERQ